MRRAHALSAAQHSAFAVMCLSLRSRSVLRLGPPRSLSHERTAEMFAQRTKARAQLAPIRTRVVAESSRAEPKLQQPHALRSELEASCRWPRVESSRVLSLVLSSPPVASFSVCLVCCTSRIEWLDSYLYLLLLSPLLSYSRASTGTCTCTGFPRSTALYALVLVLVLVLVRRTLYEESANLWTSQIHSIGREQPSPCHAMPCHLIAVHCLRGKTEQLQRS